MSPSRSASFFFVALPRLAAGAHTSLSKSPTLGPPFVLFMRRETGILGVSVARARIPSRRDLFRPGFVSSACLAWSRWSSALLPFRWESSCCTSILQGSRGRGSGFSKHSPTPRAC